MHRISKPLNGSYAMRALDMTGLDISMAFDNVHHRGLGHKLSSISQRVFAIIKSFLSGRSMKVIVNGQSSETHEFNEGMPQGSLFGSTLFLPFL